MSICSMKECDKLATDAWVFTCRGFEMAVHFCADHSEEAGLLIQNMQDVIDD